MKEDEIVNQFFGYKTLFTFRVYMYLCKNFNRNFVVSPILAETLLVLILHGARGETFDEIYENLDCIICNEEDLGESVEVMMNDFINDSSPLILINKILVKKGIQIKEVFIWLAHCYFDVGTHFVNFLEPKQLAKKLDECLSDFTEGMIKSFIAPQRISRLNRALLTSAVTILAKWVTPFLRPLTQKSNFFKSENEIVTVETMTALVTCQYCNFEELKVTVIELGLQTDASVFLVLPNEREGLGALDEKMDLIFNLDHEKFVTETIDLKLPKFRIEQTINYKDIFECQGIRKVFKKLEADFTSMTEENQNCYINGIIQKVEIEVNEEGLGAPSTDSNNIFTNILDCRRTVIVNHPFAFFIKVGERIALCGRIVDPSQNIPSCVW